MFCQNQNFMRSVVAFSDFFKSWSKASESGFRAFLDYFRKSELFNIAPLAPFSRGHPAPGNRTSRTQKRPLSSHSGTSREVPRWPKITRAAPRGTIEHVRFAEPTRIHRSQKIEFTDLCPATQGHKKTRVPA